MRVLMVGDDSDYGPQLCLTKGALVVKAPLNLRAVGWVPSNLLKRHGLPESRIGQAQLALICACGSTDYGRGVAPFSFKKALAFVKETGVFTPAQLVQHEKFRQLLVSRSVVLDRTALDISFARFMAAAVRKEPPPVGSGPHSNSNTNNTNNTSSSSSPQYEMATPLNELAPELGGLQLLRSNDPPTAQLLSSLSALLSTAAGIQGPVADALRLDIWLTTTDPLDSLPHGEDLRRVAAGAASFVAPFYPYPDLGAQSLLDDPQLFDLLSTGNAAGAREFLSVSRAEQQANVLVPALNEAFDKSTTAFTLREDCAVFKRALAIAADRLQPPLPSYHPAAAVTTPAGLVGWLVRNRSRLQPIKDFLSRTGWEHQKQTAARRRAALHAALAATLPDDDTLKTACTRLFTDIKDGQVLFLPSLAHLRLVAEAASASSAAAPASSAAAAAAAAAVAAPTGGPAAWQLQLAGMTAPQLEGLMMQALGRSAFSSPASNSLADYLRQLQPQLRQLHGYVPDGTSYAWQVSGAVAAAVRQRQATARNNCLQQLTGLQDFVALWREDDNNNIDPTESLIQEPACGSSLRFSDLRVALRDAIASADVDDELLTMPGQVQNVALSHRWQGMMLAIRARLPDDDSIAIRLQLLLDTLAGSNSPAAAAAAAAVAAGPGALGALLLEQAQQRPPPEHEWWEEAAAGTGTDSSQMQPLLRALIKMLPLATSKLPKNASGRPQFTVETMKTWMSNTLGEAPRPVWGIPDGMEAYLADLFNWALGQKTGEKGAITPQQAMDCFSPPYALPGGEGSSWDRGVQ